MHPAGYAVARIDLHRHARAAHRLRPDACADSRTSPAAINSADSRVTAAGLSPTSRAIVLRSTGPWSRTARSTALSFDV
jgi:hypothetical protein